MRVSIMGYTGSLGPDGKTPAYCEVHYVIDNPSPQLSFRTSGDRTYFEAGSRVYSRTVDRSAMHQVKLDHLLETGLCDISCDVRNGKGGSQYPFIESLVYLD